VARTLKQVAGTSNINHALQSQRNYHNTATAAANEKTVKGKRLCSYRLQSSYTYRTHSSYPLATRSASSLRHAAYLHSAACTHPPPCQAIKTEHNQIESRQRISQPSIGMCVNRNQSQIRIEFDPASRPATRASLSRCHPRPMCSSSFRLSFQRCRVPAVAFVQQREHAGAGAGAERTTITCYQSVNNAIITKLCC